jgi:hypothetical protein
MSLQNPRMRRGAARAFRRHGGGRTLWIHTDRRKHELQKATVSIGFHHAIVAASDSDRFAYSLVSLAVNRMICARS